jgi:hypothetical protein
MNYCRLLPHTPLWESSFFGASSYIHEHHMNGKFEAYDLFELAHLELALFLVISTLKPTYNSSIAYGKLLQI